MPTTLVLTTSPIAPDPEAIRQAAEIIRAGGLVAFPTETVYGLGANALDAEAVAKIFAAKGRPATNPLIVHVANPRQLGSIASSWPTVANHLAGKFWPGPLTIVVNRRAGLPDAVTGGGPTVAVRCPSHPLAQSLIREAGVPIAAPSANRSGELSPTTASHVLAGLRDRIDMVLDAGACTGGIESTVVDVTGTTVRLLRPGPITVPMLEEVVGIVDIGPGEPEASDTPLPSPGMLAKHYAPRTALEVAETSAEADFLVNLYETAGLKVGRWQPVGQPEAVAANLYADLHELDAQGFDRIIATLPPPGPEWTAIRDRLTRAAATDEG